MPATSRIKGREKTNEHISFNFHRQGTKRLGLGPTFPERWGRICAMNTSGDIWKTHKRSRVGRLLLNKGEFESGHRDRRIWQRENGD